jgi:hypothetical protein
MRTIPSALADHLDGGVTTLARCWKLTRRDGATFGFTDHDRDLAFAGTTFEARTGLEAAEASASSGSPSAAGKSRARWSRLVSARTTSRRGSTTTRAWRPGS